MLDFWAEFLTLESYPVSTRIYYPPQERFPGSIIIVALSLKPRLNQDIAIKIDFEVQKRSVNELESDPGFLLSMPYWLLFKTRV